VVGSRSLFLLAVAATVVLTACTSAHPGASTATSPPAAAVGSSSADVPDSNSTSATSSTSSSTAETATHTVGSDNVPAAPSKKLHHPAFGSAERKAILDGLRPSIEHDLGQEVQFKVGLLSVQDAFAFTQCGPLTPSGKKVDYSRTRYRSLIGQGVFGDSDAPLYALLRHRKGQWKVLTFVIGPTDVAYAGWWREYGAPKAIFPYTE
jgi:hypothetical protein